MVVLKTQNLILRYMKKEDAPFMLKLLNDRTFIDNIGDRGIRTLVGAEDYIVKGAIGSYDKNGFGLYIVDLPGEGEPIGICGLVKRDGLADVDIGFALLPAYFGKGYGYESAKAVLDYAKNKLNFTRIVAITTPANTVSTRLIKKLGLTFEKTVVLAPGKPPVNLFGINFK